MTDAGTKPYLIRAIHEWCSDKGFTPYLAVVVDQGTLVPREYVRNGEIVLNVSLEATNKLHLGNESIEFQARFSGKARDISIPIGNVSAIYARENGQGMSFDVSTPGEAVSKATEAGDAVEGVKPTSAPKDGADGSKRATRLKSVGGPAQPGSTAQETLSEAKGEPADAAAQNVQALTSVPSDGEKSAASVTPHPVLDDDAPKSDLAQDPVDPTKPTGGKPRLTRVK